MKSFWKYLRTRPLGVLSLIILIILYLSMIFAEFIAPYTPTQSFNDYTYCPPNARIVLGRQGGCIQVQERRVINTATWQYVRVKDKYEPVRFFVKTELFSRIVYGSRISLTIGFIATAVSLFLAVLFGGTAGYFGGAADWGIMRLSEFFMLIPGLYLILFLRSLMSTTMDTGQSYMMITLILALVGWPASARTIRGLVHAIKREEFILNAQLEGIPSVVIIFRHIIPQTASLLIVSIALSIPGFIMSETTLSYLGLGIADPAVSWGSLIKRDISTISNLKHFPWLLNPVWLLLTVTLAFNFLGDVLRDYFDPYHAVFTRFSLIRSQKKGQKRKEK